MSINIDFQDNGDNKHGTRCAGEVRKVAPKHFIISDFGGESLHTKKNNFNYIRSLQSPLTSSVALGLLTTQVLEVSQDYLDILF